VKFQGINALRFSFACVFVVSYLSVFCHEAFADAGSDAVAIYTRIAGVPPTAAVKAQMVTLLNSNQAEQAAALAFNDPYFYNVALKDWAKPLTQRTASITSGQIVESIIGIPLSDFVATYIGMIRDNVPFDEILYGDVLYTGAAGLSGITAYAPNSNQHYVDLETKAMDLSSTSVLVSQKQSSINNVTDTAGVLTSLGFGSTFYLAGTNRAALRWAFIDFLCEDLSGIADTTRSDFHVRRDVSRSPGGTSLTYKTQCVGCHAGMDALAGAFAYKDFDGTQVTDKPGTVSPKYNDPTRIQFTDGYATTDDSWVNLWIAGPNASLQWNGASSGNGTKAFGQMLSQTGEFERCQARRAYYHVCQRNPVLNSAAANDETALIQELADRFKSSGNNMKTLIAATAVKCPIMGGN
jgi:hypothetical protein